MNLFLEPSCDIHLALNPSIFNTVELKVSFRNLKKAPEAEKDREDYIVNNITSSCNYQIIDNPAFGSIVSFTNSPNPTVNGLGLGEAYLVVDYTIGIETHFIVAKITVHQRLDSWWFGTSQLTIPNVEGIKHSQVPIYALFDSDSNGNGNIEEITGQGFVQLITDSHSSNYFSVDNHGRVLVINRSANDNNLVIQGTCIDVTITSPSSTSLPVSVLNTENGIITRCNNALIGKRNHLKNHNLLLVGEGYSSFEEFKELIETKLIPEIFQSERFSPFLHLREDINIWFLLPTANQWGDGITYPLHESQVTGVYNSDDISLANKMPLLYQMTNSHLGLSFSGRKADKISSKGSIPTTFADADKYWTIDSLRIKTDKVGGDLRRYGPSLSWEAEFKRYISRTVNVDGGEMGWLWNKNRSGAYVKDFGFVGIIVKDYYFRAWNNNTGYGYFLNSVSRRHTSDIVKYGVLEMENNFIWRLSRVFPINIDEFITDDYRKFKDTFGHEWGHSFNLGDEYEEYPNHDEFLAKNSSMKRDNLQNYRELVTPPPTIPGSSFTLPNLPYATFDIDKIKWAKLPRMEFSAVISENVFLSPLGAEKYRVKIKLKKDNKHHAIANSAWIKYLEKSTYKTRSRMKIMLYMPGSDNSLKQMRPYPPIIEKLDFENWQKEEILITFTIERYAFPHDDLGNEIIASVSRRKQSGNIDDLKVDSNGKLSIYLSGGKVSHWYVYDTPLIISDDSGNAWLIANGTRRQINSDNYKNYNLYIPKNSILFYPKIARIKKIPLFETDPETGTNDTDRPRFLYLMFQAVKRYLDNNNLPLDYPLDFNGVCSINNDPKQSLRLSQGGPERPSQTIVDQIKGVNGQFLRDDEVINDKHPYRIVGLYEGGGKHSCGVFRPSGHCKMRSEDTANINDEAKGYKSEGKYCKVCQYVIINRINPALHHTKMMDEEYGNSK